MVPPLAGLHAWLAPPGGSLLRAARFGGRVSAGCICTGRPRAALCRQAPSTWRLGPHSDRLCAPAGALERRLSTALPASGANEMPGSGGRLNIENDERRGRPVYLDMQATTPMDPRVLDAMLPFMTEQYGNAHSRTHSYGWEAERAVEDARAKVAAIIGASPKEIVFTSGATESNNIAIKGVARFYGPAAGGPSAPRARRHIITTQTEHKCVLDSCRQLEEDEGFSITYLPVASDGRLSLERLAEAITEETLLVSVMAVNNEIGVIQPIAAIGALCRQRGVFFHCDAAQAVGKVALDVEAMAIDLLSISGHKVYGPKGVGALYVRRRPRVRLHALQSGGGQERGIRSGTLPTAPIVGLGEACAIAASEMAYDRRWVRHLADRLVTALTARIPHVTRNGVDHGKHPEASYEGCINMSFSYVEGESLLMALKNIALSSGSACTSASLEPSYVLRALGADDASAHSSIRFGLGRFTTEEEVDFCIEETVRHVSRLRALSPLWEMVQEGIDINSIQWSQH